MNGKKTYSAEEKKAYYMGYGAAVAGAKFERIKKVMVNMPPVIKESYKNGLDDGYLKNVQKMKKNKR
jgi:hypothetical protein